jgi:hypothetical protein
MLTQHLLGLRFDVEPELQICLFAREMDPGRYILDKKKRPHLAAAPISSSCDWYLASADTARYALTRAVAPGGRNARPVAARRSDTRAVAARRSNTRTVAT